MIEKRDSVPLTKSRFFKENDEHYKQQQKAAEEKNGKDKTTETEPKGKAEKKHFINWSWLSVFIALIAGGQCKQKWAAAEIAAANGTQGAAADAVLFHALTVICWVYVGAAIVFAIVYIQWYINQKQ